MLISILARHPKLPFIPDSNSTGAVFCGAFFFTIRAADPIWDRVMKNSICRPGRLEEAGS
jgi:hypothetical protein